MNIDNTEIQMRKGILEFCVLHIISRGEIYASDMLEELTDAKMIIVEGTLYPLLNRLKKANLVEYNWKESVSGPPRKYFSITSEGSDFLDRLSTTWTGISTSTQHIISNKYRSQKQPSDQ